MLTTMGVHPRLWVTVPPRCVEQERDGGYPPCSSRHAEICDRETVGNSTSHFNTSPVEKFTMRLVLIIDSNMFHHALSEVHSALGWLS
jgi:hypothetical protein